MPSSEPVNYSATSLRVRCHALLCEWNNNEAIDPGYTHLMDILGNGACEWPGDIKGNMETMKALIGPNGKTIYKILLAKRGIILPK